MNRSLEEAGLKSATRHLFVCIGPDCCSGEEGQILWNQIKADLKAHRLKDILRTKAGCFRICHGGPWIVIYPEGTWYGGVTPEVWNRILHEHLIGGKVATDQVALTHPLESGPSAD